MLGAAGTDGEELMATVLLVPGHLCDASIYAPQREALAGHEIFFADTTRDDTIAGMADRLLGQAPERFVVAGLSMGGMVAMEVIARAPGRVLGACLMDTDPTPARPREIEWRNGLLKQGFAAYVETFVGRFYAHDRRVAARLESETRARMLATPEPVARAQARALDRRRDMAPLIAGFPGPVEILVGAEDRVCPPRLHAPLAGVLPDAALTEIPGCGHIATLECPSEVNARLSALLARIAG
jgi:pimeloyl-ACP methyl ester carboxylesterase